jgi:hypothetical protein
MSSATKSLSDLSGKLSFYQTPTTDSSTQQASGLVGSITGLFKPVAPATNDEESAGLMSWASSQVQQVTQTKERLTTFVILAVAGTICMLLAFTFLPMIIFSPHKFAVLFTIGSVLWLSGFSVMRGHKEFVSHLTSRERLPFSLSYGLSLVGTVYCSLIMGSYVLTLVFSAIQIIALSYFLVSYIPGGTGALTMLGGLVGSSVRSAVVR